MKKSFPPQKILIAPAPFKESLTARAAALAMARGVRRAIPGARIKILPLADGGEGTAAVLLKSLGGRWRRTRVKGPLGAPVRARWGFSDRGKGRRAFMEMAEASGLALVPPGKRDPLRATTFGTGQLIRAALDAGCREIWLGIGGSATVDGGTGLAEALGARFLDGAGNLLPPGGGALPRLHRIDISGWDRRLKKLSFRVACDVTNPLSGPRGAAAVFGPQKGASPAEVKILDRGLKNFARVVRKDLGKEADDFPGAGAAGGLGSALAVFLNARLEPGIELILKMVQAEKWVAWADLVLTGEGRADGSSAEGKVISGLARLCRTHKKHLVVLAGRLGPGAQKLLGLGVTSLRPLSIGREDRRRDFREAPRRLAREARRAMELFTR